MTLYTEEEIQKWRNRVRGQRKRHLKTYHEWLKKVTTQWKPEEWDKFRAKLEKFSLAEVRLLANKTGMKFAGGNSKITDKEEFVWILDEADKDELISEYHKLIKIKSKVSKQ